MSRTGVIGGSGLYEMQGLQDVRNIKVETPFGPPSDEFVTGTLDGTEMVFLPRHGKGHRLLPSEVNYRANIFAMKTLGVDKIISISAVGSLKEEIQPGHIVIPDQFIDRTRGYRKDTFFGNGIVAHASLADPVCPDLSERLHAAAKAAGAISHKGGTYICMEGPAFSTRAESFMYRSIGGDIIGMTNLTEAKLAREAEICYGTVALSTDYDCWHETHDDVTVDAILEIIHKNVEMGKSILRHFITSGTAPLPCQCGCALENAIITDRSCIPSETVSMLGPIVSKYLKQGA